VRILTTPAFEAWLFSKPENKEILCDCGQIAFTHSDQIESAWLHDGHMRLSAPARCAAQG
jgi:hypothetical protein